MSKTQWVTLLAFGAYFLWEFVLLAGWKAETQGPLIRVDLLIIYPALLILAVVSAFQFFRR
ncbi:MAG: hypothetical protein ABJX32_11695 [Tateyamaria sp.]|uniref:hypothetical protein n=1 Tax=Tateyamaria sp. TaxID=1929288 RepID=UPI00329CADD2